MERRLTVILAADVVGYSRLMSIDEERTLAALNAHRDRIDDLIEGAGGRVFGSAGDSVIAEFQSPVAAVRCALKIQRDLTQQDSNLPTDQRMRFRIGVNLGDVMVDGDNLFGDGVNIAARLEARAPPGGICISRQVAEQIAGKVDAPFASAGAQNLKNIGRPVEISVWPPQEAQKMRQKRKTRPLAIAALALSTVVAAAAWLALAPRNTDSLPSGARVATVPFQNLSANADDAFFSEGLSRDINALLANFSNLFVFAPEATAAYRDDPNCAKMHEELGADFILTGAVQRSAEHLRVTARLTDARTCRQLTPPGPFDIDPNAANLLDIQIDIARKVAAAVGSSDAPLFRSGIVQAIREKAPESLSAYECVFLSYWFYQTFSLEAHRKARDCLLRTVESEPGYSLGWSRLAFTYIESKKRDLDTPPDWARRARDAANKALNEDPDNPDAYYALAVLSRMIGDEKEVFLANARKAIELNPNDSWILADLGIFLAYAGEWKQGKEWITRARALNPKLHPGFGYAWTLHSIVLGDYRDAINRQLSSGADHPMTMTSLMASYALNGEREKADEILADLRKRFPDHLKDPLAPFRARKMAPELMEKLREGLRLVGVDVPAKAEEQ